MPSRILAIDDSLTIRKLLEMVLGKAGYSLELAATGQEGVNRAKRGTPNLILLDYVLPDMKGTEVCAQLAREESLRGVPIVLMSAKSDDVRVLFKNIPSVVDFISKPFTPPEITFLVAKVLKSKPGSATSATQAAVLMPQSSSAALISAASAHSTPLPAAAPGFSFAQKESAAKVVYAKMRERFGKIPAFAAQIGNEAPEMYFAKKILTPDLMDSLLAGLAPLLQAPAPAAPKAEEPHAVLFQGQTSVLPVMTLLKTLGTLSRSGVLTLVHGLRETLLYLRRGEIILATHNHAEDYARQAQVSLSNVTSDEIDAAAQAQKRTGKPLYVSLAEAGRLTAAELPALLYQQGKRVLLEAVEAGPGAFKWEDMNVLPEYVDAYGRNYALEQLILERLRQIDDWSQVELHVNSLDLVYQRSQNFSRNLKHFELTDNERRVLTMVDQRNTVKQIIERSGVTTFEVFHILFRLSQVDLIRKHSGYAEHSGSHAAVSAPAPVMIMEADVAGIQEPLGNLLRRRQIPLVNLNGESRLTESFLKERPRLIVLNVGSPGLDAESVVREIRATLEISDVPLAAVLDTLTPGRAEALRAAGFNAVLVKPFLFRDLEALIAG